MFQVVGWKSTARRSRNGTECARPYLVAGVQPSPAAATSARSSASDSPKAVLLTRFSAPETGALR